MQTVALVGLRVMGMAENLLKAGFPLTIYKCDRRSKTYGIYKAR